jgi:hypothetical protein
MSLRLIDRATDTALTQAAFLSPASSVQTIRRAASLTEADAIEIWIARWLRTRPRDLVVRYGCDGRRLYDIWWGKTFPGSRSRAKQVFIERYPGSADRSDFGYRKIPRGGSDPRQGSLFDQVR